MSTTTTTATSTKTSEHPLQYLPIGLFGSVMGLSGLSSAWRLAHAHSGAPEWIAQAVGAVAVAVFVALLIAYAVKAIASPAAVRAEFRHPIAGNLFGTLIISFLLLPLIVAPGYALCALHEVYGGRWYRTALRALGALAVHLVTLGALAAATLSR